jgi:inhibitor of cysteine peptidase
MAELVLDSARAGQSRSAAPGDVVVVRLAETPTSGYRWDVDEFDAGVLEPAGDTFTPAAEAGVGGGGTRELRFKVVGPGDGGLKLTRRRAWEADRSGVERFDATIHVKG